MAPVLLHHACGTDRTNAEFEQREQRILIRGGDDPLVADGDLRCPSGVFEGARRLSLGPFVDATAAGCEEQRQDEAGGDQVSAARRVSKTRGRQDVPPSSSG